MANDVSNFRIDQRGTFAAPLALLQCDPKMAFGSDKQERTKDGSQGKWELQVLARVPGFGGKVESKVLKIGMVAATNPADGVPPFAPIELGDLELGIMERTKRSDDGSERVIGHTVWMRCTEITLVPIAPAGTGDKPGKAA